MTAFELRVDLKNVLGIGAETSEPEGSLRALEPFRNRVLRYYVLEIDDPAVCLCVNVSAVEGGRELVNLAPTLKSKISFLPR